MAPTKSPSIQSPRLLSLSQVRILPCILSLTLSIRILTSSFFLLSGDAIYYSSGMWPYTVNTLISLDGGSPTLVDLTDHSSEVINGPETVASSVVWSQTGLDATIQHTLVISVGPGQQYAVVDSLMYVLHAPRSPCVVSFFLQIYQYRPHHHHHIRVDEYRRHLYLKQQQRSINTDILL